MNIVPLETLLIILGLIGSYFLIILLMQVMLLALAGRRLQMKRTKVMGELPPLTLLIPARNEAQVIIETLKRILALEIRGLRIIVIENQSADHTLKLLQDFTKTADPERLHLLESPEAGKARALNLALAHVTTDFVATIDADTIPHEQGLRTLLSELHARPELTAVGGVIRVLSGAIRPPWGWLESMQSIEYLRAFTGERLGWGLLRGNIVLSGACAVFRTQSLRAIGGFQSETVTEDLETALELVKQSKLRANTIEILPVIAASTQVPTKLTSLLGQRRRWQAGLCQCLWKYRSLMLSSRHGLVGTLTLPYLFLAEAVTPLLEILSPLLIAHVLFYFPFATHPIAIVIVGGTTLAAVLNAWSGAMENRHLTGAGRWSLMRVFILSFPLVLLYRPIVSLARLEATLRFPWIVRWGKMQRKELPA